MALQISQQFPLFSDVDGSPLTNGFIYIGTQNLNPETNPIACYWDYSLTLPAPQPFRTNGGYIVRNGSPANVYINSFNYSITVRNKSSSLVYASASATNSMNVRLDSVIDLLTISAGSVSQVSLSSYYPGWAVSTSIPVGGGTFIWDSAMPKSSHNGGTIISNTVPWDGTHATLSAFLAGTGETAAGTNGCWVRSDNNVEFEMFGAKGDFNPATSVGTDDTVSIQSAINFCSKSGKRQIDMRAANYYCAQSVYGYYDAVLNPGYNSSTLQGARMSIVGKGQMWRQDWKLNTYTGSVFQFAQDKGLVLANGGTQLTVMIDIQKCSIIGDHIGKLFDANFAPNCNFDQLFIGNNNTRAAATLTGVATNSNNTITYTGTALVGDHIVATGIPNGTVISAIPSAGTATISKPATATATGLTASLYRSVGMYVSDSWIGTISNIDVVGIKAFVNTSSGGVGRGFWFESTTAGGGNNRFENITGAFFAFPMQFGHEYDAARAGIGVMSRNNLVLNCQGQNGYINTRFLHGFGYSEIQNQWCENASVADLEVSNGSTGLHFVKGNFDSDVSALKGISGNILLGNNTGNANVDALNGIVFEGTRIWCFGTGTIRYNGAKDVKFLRARTYNGGGSFVQEWAGNGGGELMLEDIDYFPTGASSEIAQSRRISIITGTGAGATYADSSHTARYTDFPAVAITASLDMSTWRYPARLIRTSTTGGSLTVTLPSGFTSATTTHKQECTVQKRYVANSVTIDAGAGVLIGATQTIALTAAESFVSVSRQVAGLWNVLSKSAQGGSFTLAAAATGTIGNVATQTASIITLTPTNASAAALMNGTKSLYVSAKTAGTSFTVATGDGTNAVGTETFDYIIN